MGKTDNIKRAKKLKEAKRKREQDTFISAGLGPASLELQKRTELNGDATKANHHVVKYSELLAALISPIIEKHDNIDIVKSKYSFGTMAWNAAIIREKDENMYQKARKDIMAILPDDEIREQLFDSLVIRKQKEFSEYENFIVDFEIKKIKGADYDLSVATSISND